MTSTASVEATQSREQVTLAALADGMAGRLPDADPDWLPDPPRWVAWLIPNCTGRLVATFLSEHASPPPGPGTGDRASVGVALWQQTANDQQWCSKLQGNGYRETIRTLPKQSGLRNENVQQQLRAAVITVVRAETGALTRTLAFSAGRNAVLIAAIVVFAIVVGQSWLESVGVLAVIVFTVVTFSVTQSSRIVRRRRGASLRTKTALGVAVLLLAAWAVNVLIDDGQGGLTWWRAGLLGTFALVGVSVLSRLMFAASVTLYDRRPAREQLDSRVLYTLIQLRHLATHHRDDWGTPAVARRVDRLLEDGALAVQRNLVRRLRPRWRLSRRRELRPHADGIAAAMRTQKKNVARAGGREALVQYATDGLRRVVRGEWLDLPHQKVTTPPPWRTGVGILITGAVPLMVAVAPFVEVPATVRFACAVWVLVQLAMVIDPVGFAKTLQATSTMAGVLRGASATVSGGESNETSDAARG